MELLEAINQWLDEHYFEMESDLLRLVAIDSVRGESEDGAPFGRGPAKALDCCLQIGERQGFITENMSGYVGIVTLPGKSDEQIGVLSHVDVVPADATDWSIPPFSPKVWKDMIWGRGTVDDKGPLIACQYALMALKECKAPLHRSICHVIGTNEETGMACIEYYKEHAQNIPIMGFSPDAMFPVVQGEKGILRWTVSCSWDEECVSKDAAIRLVSLTGGSEINCVPDRATAHLVVNDQGERILTERGCLNRTRYDDGLNITIKQRDIFIECTGKAVHASIPQMGDNAILKMLRFLSQIDDISGKLGYYLRKIALFFEDDYNGGGLGIAMSDDYGRLTNLLSLIEMDEQSFSFSCDTRYPISANGDEILKKIARIAEKENMEFTCWCRFEPLFYNDEHPLIKGLIEVYRDHTKDDSPALVIGSGTYAHKLANFVSYGPIFPGSQNLTHQANERISTSDLRRMAKIYANAIFRLANAP